MENTAMKNAEQVRFEVAKINTKDLIPHPIVQREFDKANGDRLAKKWDWNKYEPICDSVFPTWVCLG